MKPSKLLSLLALQISSGLYYVQAQCDLTISPSSPSPNCLYAYENVVWTSGTNVSTTNNDISKNAGGNSWNAGASSTASVFDYGWVETVVNETNRDRMFGLSTTDTDADYTTIQYAVHLRSNGNLRIYESGSNRGDVGSYSSGDVIRIKVDNGQVKYYRNSTLVYNSNVTPTLPLIVDVSLYNVSATLENVVIANGTDGNFSASVTSAGTGPTYQWQLNGLNVGTNNASYTNIALVDGDELTCQFTPGAGGCGITPETSNTITLRNVPTEEYGTAYITTDPEPNACMLVREEVSWSELVNLRATGNNINKIQGGNSWNGSAFSNNTVSNNGYVETIIDQTGRDRMFGLGNTNASPTNEQYAFHIRGDNGLRVRESGSERGSFGSITNGDVLRIAIEQGEVKYYRNGSLLYISQVTPTLPLNVDISLEDQGGQLSDITVVNGSFGTFNANVANVGTSPTLQWRLNGASVGTNSATYTNASIVPGDQVTLDITPDLNGCAGTTYTTTMVAVEQRTELDFGYLYVSTQAEPDGCLLVREEVSWSQLANLQDTGNNLNKTQGGNSWNASAFSHNTVDNNGYAETIIDNLGRDRMFGLSSTNASPTNERYSFHIRGDNGLRVRELGSERGSYGSVAVDDTLRIAVEQGEVKYYKNSTLLYISSLVPTLPLHVDLSIEDQDGRLSDITIVNGSFGVFSANTTNVGTNPSYQWRLNGTPVGTNNTTYTNTAIVPGDEITVEVTPDLTGCATTSYTTSLVKVEQRSELDFGYFYVSTDQEPDACLLVREPVAWSQLTNVEATGNNLNKIQGGNSWNGSAYSHNTVSNNGYAETVIAQTGRDRVFGLSNTNQSILNEQFMFYMRGDNGLRIRESGTERGAFGSITNGDVLRIAVEQGEVKYYRNGDLLYVSQVAPALPLGVDISFEDQGGRLSDITVVNGSFGSFNANVSNAGASPTFQWRLNGTPVGTNSATYSNTAIAPGDQLTVEVTPDLTGCTTTAYTTSVVTVEQRPELDFGYFYVSTDQEPDACLLAREPVAWSQLTNVEATGNNLNKIQGGNSWNGSAYSHNTVSNNGYAETVIAQTGRDRVFGLSNTNQSILNEQFMFYMRGDNGLRIRESGTERGAFGSITNGDVLRIAVEQGEVKYYRNGDLLYVSQVAPALPLGVDISFEDQGGRLSDITVVNGSFGSFNANVSNAGASPTFQWRLNGTPVGTNSATYTNTALAPGDQVTVEMIPDLTGCNTVTYTTSIVTVEQRPELDFGFLYVSSDQEPDACLLVREPVAWSQLTNVEATGNNLNKIQGGNSWNGSAFSLNTINNNGYAETVIDQLGRDRVFGLGSTNASILNERYSLYIRGDNGLRVRELGTERGSFGSVAVDDTLRISVEQGEVKYYKNNTLLYISSLTPTLPLYVDISFQDQDGRLSDITAVNGSIGVFDANVANAGTNPTFQWRLNGAPVGTNSSTYTNSAIVQGDEITVEVTPDLIGCTTVTYTTSVVTVEQRQELDFGYFYVSSQPEPNACLLVREPVDWFNLVNVEATGNNLNKIQGGNSWNASAYSFNAVMDNGYVETTIDQTGRNRTFGLSSTNTSPLNEQFSFYIRGDNGLRVRESGTERGAFGSITNGDVLRITLEQGEVKYYRNGNLLYVSQVAPVPPLRVDIGFEDQGGRFSDIIVANGSQGVFTANVVNVGTNPTFQWKLNGTNVGTNSNTYINNAIVAGDAISVEVTPDLVGCTTTTYETVQVTVEDKSTLDFGELYVTAQTEPLSCLLVSEEVTWTSLVNLEVIGSTLNKLQGGNSWNASALSQNRVVNNGYAQTVVDQTNQDRVFGLSDTNIGVFNVRYGFLLRSNGSLRVYESGTNRGDFGTYALSDVLRIAVENGQVRYYRNSTLLYTSSVAPTLPLFVDIAIEDQSGRLLDVAVVNGSNATFDAVTTNMGTNPTYQWKLNGADVGTNSPNYTNNMLSAGDLISVDVTPDIAGCSGAIYTSKNITILGEDPARLTTITSVTATDQTDCGVNDGTITVAISGGTSNMEYSIDGGSTWQASNVFNGLAPATYNVSVRLAEGICQVDYGTPTVINALTPPTINTVSATNPTDCGVNDASITVTASSGTGSFEYSVDGGTTWQTSNVFNNLSPSTYNISVRNDDGTCQVNYASSTIINALTPPTIDNVAFTTPTDCGMNNASITVTASSGTGSFEYSVDGGTTWQTSSTFNGLSPNTYNVSVRNDNGTCQMDYGTSIIINALTPPTIDDVVVTAPDDCGLSNASITVSASSGTGNFEYSIDGGSTWQASNTFGPLAPNTYNVSVRNDNGICQVDYGTATVINPLTPPTIDDVAASDPTDCGLNNGSITITASSGTGSFEYSIDAGATWQTSNTFDDLTPGTYNASVRNDNGTCQVDYGANTVINSLPLPVITSVNSSDPSYCGATDGSITVNTSGTSLEYSADGGTTWQTTNAFNNLSAGTYQIAVRNNDGTCLVNHTSDISLLNINTPIFNDVTSINVDNCQLITGSISISASGGSGVFQYSIDGRSSWSDNATFTDLGVGNYDVYLRNQDGTCETAFGLVAITDVSCSVEANDDNFMTQEAVVLMESVFTNDVAPASSVITLISETDNGQLELQNNGSFTYTPENLFSGTDQFIYEVCAGSVCDQAMVSITIEADLNIEVYDAFSPNGDNENDIWTIQGIHNHPNNSVKVFDRWGTLVFETTGYDNFNNSWTGETQGKTFGDNNAPEGTYFYVLKLNNEQEPITGYISLFR